MLNRIFMPKKTKKQKIMSQKRRELFFLQQLNKSEGQSDLKKTEKKNKILSVSNEKSLLDQDKDIKNYFIQDFKKSVLIIAIIIALEIVLYFGTINKYFN